MTGCGDSASVAQPVGTTSQRIRLAGSSTIAPLMKAMSERYRETHPKTEFEILTGGSTKGVGSTRSGAVEIGMVSRDLSATEKELYSFRIARDGVCCLVHKDNPVTTLSKEHAIEIYTGRVANWRIFGGNDAPIHVLTRKEGHSEIDVFSHYLGLKASDIKAADFIGESQDGVSAIVKNQNAIIYVSVGESERAIMDGSPVKILQADNVAASVATIRNGLFPITRSLILITKDIPKGEAKNFIDFVISPQNKDLIVKFQFVTLTE